jgi:hypothetical protein
MLLVVLLAAHLQQASALYHTSSEVLHWFSHWAAKRPDVLRCACSRVAVALPPCWPPAFNTLNRLV